MRKLLLIATLVTAGVASPALAEEYVVEMLNKGTTGVMAFEPALIKIAPGDTVRFVPTHKTHNAESIPGMAPAGATPFKGSINKEVSITFTTPGLYGYKCLPHYAMGMVGLVVVGTPDANLAEARTVKHPGRAKPVFNTLFEDLSAVQK
jgi:pseudoazurin